MSRRFILASVTTGLFLVSAGCSHGSTSPSASSATPSTPSPSASATVSAQDLMTMQWPSYDAANGQMQPEVVSSAAPITLPASTSTSNAGVPTGFPKTPEGALAQLKAIDEAGLKNLTADTARKVYSDSFESGNPSFYQDGWVGPIVDKFSNAKSGSYTAEFNADQGLIRGTAEDGSFVYACVLGKLQTSSQYNSQTLPAPDCEALRWNGHRWMGVPQSSVQGPDVSPHSAAAYGLGFRDLGV